MARYLDQTGLQDYTTQLTAKYKTVFATKNEVGAPLVASTAAAMTDTSKIYVYVGSESGYTSGNWYYYNGTAWVSGGVYNSTAFETDTTLSVAGMAADAAVTGKAVTETANELGLLFAEVRVGTLWTQGNINYNTGENISSTTRARTNNYIPTKTNRIKVTAADGYKFAPRYYSAASPSTITGYEDFTTGTHTYEVQAGQYVRFICAHNNDATMSANDALNNITISYVWPEVAQEDVITPLRVTNASRNWYQFGQGSVGLNTGNLSDATNRCRTGERNANNFADGKLFFWVSAGWKYRLAIYDSGSYAYGIDWQTKASSLQLSDTQTVRAVLAKTDESDCQPSEITDDVFLMYGFLKNGNSDSSVSALNGFHKTQEKLVQLHGHYKINTTPTYAPNPLTLLHFSDIHADIKNIQRIIQFKGEFANYIDDVIHTGDSVDNSFSDGYSWFAGLNGGERILNVIGNHDTRVGSDWDAKTAAESYTTYFAPYIANWGASYTANLCYYYKDYSTQKARLIVLDSQHMDAAQLSWFESTLASAKTAGCAVVVAAHVKPSKDVTPLQTTFDDSWFYGNGDGATSSGYPYYLDTGYSQAVDAFIKSGGQFACWLCGHLHYSLFATVRDYPNQLIIGVTTAAAINAQTTVAIREIGTKSMDAFNVISIDPYLGLVKMIPIGNDYDLRMRHRDSICWDYVNGQILYTR